MQRIVIRALCVYTVVGALLASSGCSLFASYKALPVAPTAGKGFQPFAFKYQATKFFFLKSEGKATVERIYANPADPSNILISVTAPQIGLFATLDGGASWKFNSIGDTTEEVSSNKNYITITTTTTRVFRDLLFDPRNPKIIYGVGYNFWRSDDAGITWNKYEIARGGFLGGQVAFRQLLLDADGTLFANSGEDIFSSTDKGATWAKLKIGDAYSKGGFEKFNRFTGGTNFHIQSMARDPADPRTLYASLESNEAASLDNLKAVLFSVGYADPNPKPDSEFAAMQTLIRSKETKPQKVTWDKGKDGIYVSHDNGATWQTSGLMIRAWLVRIPGDSAIYVVTADKTLSSCLVIESHPKIAALLQAQMTRAKEQGLRSLHRSDEEKVADKAAADDAGSDFYLYPDIDQLLFHHLLNTIVYKSTDLGASWARIFNPSRPILTAMRAASEKQETAITTNIDNAGAGPNGHPGAGAAKGASSTEVPWFDPFSILMNHNYHAPLDGLTCSADGQTCFAYVPTQAY